MATSQIINSPPGAKNNPVCISSTSREDVLAHRATREALRMKHGADGADGGDDGGDGGNDGRYQVGESVPCSCTYMDKLGILSLQLEITGDLEQTKEAVDMSLVMWEFVHHQTQEISKAKDLANRCLKVAELIAIVLEARDRCEVR